MQVFPNGVDRGADRVGRVRCAGTVAFEKEQVGAHLHPTNGESLQSLGARGRVGNVFSGTKDNIAHLLESPYFELMRHAATFPLDVEVDEIDNLACPASPIHDQFDPVQATKTSVHGAINMLGLGPSG